jgi:hypothetical protein
MAGFGAEAAAIASFTVDFYNPPYHIIPRPIVTEDLHPVAYLKKPPPPVRGAGLSI